MYHSITFGDKNTWDDWHLVPTSRPAMEPPDPRTSYVEVPGASGSIDISEALTGSILFNNRKGSISFYVMNGYGEWYHRYSEIMNYLHGQRMEVFLEDDPTYFYIGRFRLNAWNSEKDRSQITIQYELEPYKVEIQSSKDDWLWNPFDFEIGIIRDYGHLRVDGELKLEFYGSRKATIPAFDVLLDDDNEPISLKWSGTPDKSYALLSGTGLKLPDIKIIDGVTTMTFTGKGYVSIDYRGGSL